MNKTNSRIIGKLKKSKIHTHFKPGLVLILLLSVTISGVAKEEKMTKAEQIHNEVLTVDTHCDTPMSLLDDDFDIGIRNDFKKNRSRIDFPRMKEGGMDAVFFAVFLGQGPITPEGHKNANAKALKVFEAIHKVLKKYGEQAELALTPHDAYRIEKKGKRAIYIGVENGYPIGEDVSLIKKYYDLGARYITLCHTRNNAICDSSTDDKGPLHGGLSEFGKKVVAEMNRLGMMIDVSHISDKSFYDVLNLSRGPVIASHSSARAICDNPRNLDDAMLKEIARKGGVVQACILSDYVKKPAPNAERDKAFKDLYAKYHNYDELSAEAKKVAHQEFRDLRNKYPSPLATVAEFVDHIDHIVKVAGIDHVGIGTDFDGGGGLKDCEDISQMGNITAELVKRGYNKEQIRKIWGGNVMRVFRQVEKLTTK